MLSDAQFLKVASYSFNMCATVIPIYIGGGFL